MRRCVALVLAMLVATGSAHADDVSAEAPPPSVSPGRRALAIIVAIVPGFVLRGAGSWLVGEKRAAKRLAIGTVGGLVIAGAAGGLIGQSGGNPYTTAAVPLVLVGAGALLTSWVEDIWIAAGGPSISEGPRAEVPWSLELGEVWQHGEYRERLLQRGAASIAYGRFGASTAGLIDTNGEAWLVFADLRARVFGSALRGDWINVRTGGRLQRDRADRVTQLVGELEVSGRLDLTRFERAFRGTFVELSAGLGFDRVTYNSMVSEVDSLLLGRFLWGAYIPARGEFTVYYDHRRDGLAGGIDAWRASGFMGSFGVAADVRIDGPWALRGEFQLGGSYVSTLALAYRGGPR